MKRLALAVLAAAVVAIALPAAAQKSDQGPPHMAQLLFVQNAAGVELGAGGRSLTLKGLSPTTLFFSDRPVRIAGHYRIEEYLDFWKNGPDSFLKDPPNATLSVFQKGKEELSDVVVTLRNPRVSGSDITYDVTVISGTLPQGGGPVSLFIDIIGLPFTPLSFAGVARRTAYRTVVWGSAAAASASAAARLLASLLLPAGARPGRLSAAGPDGARHRNRPDRAGRAGREPGPGLRGGEAEGAEVAAEPGADQRGAVPGRVAEAAEPDRAVMPGTRNNPGGSAITPTPTFAARLLAAALAALIALPPAALAQAPARSAPAKATPAQISQQKVELLFVQNASGIEYDKAKGTLKMKDVARSTLFFTDRPVRMAGHYHTRDEFLPLWSEGPDSFAKNPPNATLSMLEVGKADLQNAVINLKNPRVQGRDLIYDITVIEGMVPQVAGDAVLFIDVLGFWRRNIRRVAVIGTATAVTTAAVATTAAASDAAAARAAAPPPPPPPATVNVQVTQKPAAPAAAPQSASTQKLEQLKSLLSEGRITEAQYQKASTQVLNQLVQ